MNRTLWCSICEANRAFNEVMNPRTVNVPSKTGEKLESCLYDCCMCGTKILMKVEGMSEEPMAFFQPDDDLWCSKCNIARAPNELVNPRNFGDELGVHGECAKCYTTTTKKVTP